MFLLAAALFVSPGGSDANPGTAAKPLATLQAAVQASRRAEPPRRIVLKGGKYYDVSVTLGPEDSGLTVEAAPGEKPVLYGGIPLKGWEKDGDRFVSAPLPTRSGGGWEIRLLQVDGKMQPRARYPAEGTLTHQSVFDVPWMSSTAGGWKRKPTDEELTTLKYKPGDLPATLETKNAEITVYHMWDESVVGVSAHDPVTGTLTLSPAAGHPPGAFGVKKYVVWNVREGMTAPGQWYHDRARGRVVYWPLPGQDMRRAEVVAPTAETVLRLRGTSAAPVKNVTLRGLSVAVTTVPLVAAGFAAARFDGAISLEHATDCLIDGVSVSNVAGHAMNTRAGCTGTRVENGEIGHCGAGGVYVGGTGAVIHNNHVHDVGLMFPSAIGIYRGGKGNRVSHNEVHGCSYSAINYGGQDNVVEDNLIYDCMKVLHDGAGIYMFGAKNCILRRNLIRDIVDTGGYGASAYYLDEQSEGCVVENNLSLRVGWPSHNHMAKKNAIRNNVFLVDGDAKITFPRSSDYTVERNVLHATGKIRIHNPEAVTTWADNLFYSGAGQIEGVPLNDYSPAGKVDGVRPGVTAADPRFVDAAKGDYRFREDSPAVKLGIAPIDVSRAGRIAPAAKPAAATEERMSYLDNGTIRIGVNLDLGGAITYLSKSGTDLNLINSHDWGRQIQMSHYSGPVPFAPNGKEPHRAWTTLGWNPIQSGDVYGNRSRLLEHRNDGKELYVKSVPMQWPLNNEPGECTFECWIRLDGPVAKVRSRMLNRRSDKTQYQGRHQELPAVYTNGPWWRLMTYSGDRPFTNGELTQIPAKMPWTGWQATENWAALVNDEGQGLGIWEPGAYSFLGGFAGKPGAGGPKNSPTGYIAPLHSEIIDHNIDYEYRYDLIVGSLDEIRRYVYTQAKRPTPPTYRFEKDRQHWHYINAVDTGWPIKGELGVLLEKGDPQIIGPSGFWQAADAPKLYVDAAFQTGEKSATVFWKRHDAPNFSERQRLTFDIIPDGKYRVYEIDLASSPEYRGAITGLRIDPVSTGRPGDRVRIRSIGFRK